MENDFMNMTEKIEQRRLKVEEALTQEMEVIDQALPKLREYLTKQINNEMNLLKADLKQQEDEHYQTLLLHLQAIEAELEIEVKVTKDKEGKLRKRVWVLKESLAERIGEKLKIWEK